MKSAPLLCRVSFLSDLLPLSDLQKTAHDCDRITDVRNQRCASTTETSSKHIKRCTPKMYIKVEKYILRHNNVFKNILNKPKGFNNLSLLYANNPG